MYEIKVADLFNNDPDKLGVMTLLEIKRLFVGEESFENQFKESDTKIKAVKADENADITDSPDLFCLELVVQKKHLNVNGTVDGGIMYTLCDESSACRVTFAGKKGAASDGSIHYYRPAKLGDTLYAYVTDRKIGRRMGIYAIALKNDKDKLIADAMFTIVYREEA